MHTYRLTLEYDGSHFHGWQRQPNVRTVEGELRRAALQLTGEEPVVTASGRTDAGAHAHGQVAGLTIGAGDWEPARLRRALNALLPEDVVISAVERAADDFHARYDAVTRQYRYLVVNRGRRAPMARRFAWQVSAELDLEAMRRAAGRLHGTHDFAAFGRSPQPLGSTVRTIAGITVSRSSGIAGGETFSVVIIDVVADAFLYGMMRSIAGALVAVGQSRLTEAALASYITSPHDQRVKLTVAPAHGLHQWTVTYPDPRQSNGVAAIRSEQN